MARVTQLKSAGRQRPRRLQGIEFLSRRPGPFDPGRSLSTKTTRRRGWAGAPGAACRARAAGPQATSRSRAMSRRRRSPPQPADGAQPIVRRAPILAAEPCLADQPAGAAAHGRQPGDVDPLEQLLTGVGQAAADPLSTALAALGGAGAKKPPSTPKPDPIAGELEQLMRQAQKETRTIHHLDGKTWVDPPKSRAELAPHVEALYYSSRGKYGNKLPKLLDGQGRPRHRWAPGRQPNGPARRQDARRRVHPGARPGTGAGDPEDRAQWHALDSVRPPSSAPAEERPPAGRPRRRGPRPASGRTPTPSPTRSPTTATTTHRGLAPG